MQNVFGDKAVFWLEALLNMGNGFHTVREFFQEDGVDVRRFPAFWEAVVDILCWPRARHTCEELAELGYKHELQKVEIATLASSYRDADTGSRERQLIDLNFPQYQFCRDFRPPESDPDDYSGWWVSFFVGR